MEAVQTDGGAQSPASRIVMVPSPGMGHLIPLIEFAKRLLAVDHHFAITFAIPSDGPPTTVQNSVLNSLPPQIRHLFLPPVTFDDLPPNRKLDTIIALTVLRSVSSLRDLFKSMALQTKTNLVALVVDHFGSAALHLGKEFNVPSYIFFPPSAMSLAATIYLPELDELITGEYSDHPDPILIPGCIPFHGRDLLEPTEDRQNEAYKLFLHNAKGYRFADGIFVNSFQEIEPGPINALQLGQPPVYPVGPLVRIDENGSDEGVAECLNWLDEQPHGSVLLVSFGSRGTLSSEQTMELAKGLEMSGQKFLWVVRIPTDKEVRSGSDKEGNGSAFDFDRQNDPLRFLPEGFVERNRGRGLVVAWWAAQARILRHGSIGGFVSHCGWSSVLESVVNGVPLIAWPLYAEQKMNAVMLTEETKVALRPKMNEENGIVEKEEISKVVKSLLYGEEGKKLRAKMKDLKEVAERAVEEDGCSVKALREVVTKWKSKISS